MHGHFLALTASVLTPDSHVQGCATLVVLDLNVCVLAFQKHLDMLMLTVPARLGKDSSANPRSSVYVGPSI